MEDIEADLDKLRRDAATVEEFRQDLEEQQGEKLPGLFSFSAILKNKQTATETMYEETVDTAQDTLRSFGEDFEDVDVRLGIWLTRLLCLITTLSLADEENHMADLKQVQGCSSRHPPIHPSTHPPIHSSTYRPSTTHHPPPTTHHPPPTTHHPPPLTTDHTQARKEKAELAKKRKEESDANAKLAKGQGQGQGQGEAGAPQSLGLMDSLLQQAKRRGAANAGGSPMGREDTESPEPMSMHELAKHKSMKLRAANMGEGDSDESSESSDSDGEDWEVE